MQGEQGAESDIERFTRLIKARNIERIEYERDHVSREHLAALVDLYWSVKEWEQKAAVIDLVQDTIDPQTRPIMLDFLRAPADQIGDYLQMSKIIALCHLEGRLENFSKYYKDRQLIQPAAQAYLTGKC
jgi:hypothetical protein